VSGRNVVADIETNGLIPELTTIHCLGVIDLATGEEFLFEPHQVEEGLRFLAEECAMVVGHNFALFDMKAIKKVYPEWHAKIAASCTIVDTLVATKCVWPSDRLWGMDTKLVAAGKLPPEMRKRYSLEAFGYRLGEHKGAFGKTADWSTYTPEMGQYMMQDCRVNATLWRKIKEKWPTVPIEVFILEAEAAEICERQQRVGYSFDKAAALRLLAELQNEMADIEKRLQVHFPPWAHPTWDVIGKDPKGRAIRRPKVLTVNATRQAKDILATHTIRIERLSPKTGKPLKAYKGPPLVYYEKGAEYCPVVFKEFNPTSRDDVADRLQRLHGWKPTEFTPEGKPKVDETVLLGIQHLPPVPDLLKYFVLSKTVGMLAEGGEGWLRRYNDKTKRIHHRCDANGTITGRAAHSRPNLGQVQKVLSVDE